MRSLPSRAAGALAVVAAVTLSGCSLFSSGSATPTGVATQPPGNGQAGTLSPSATPTGSGAAQTSGERTVLVQDGLRIHSSASLSASVLGTAAWGVTLTVLGYDASGGPWPDSTSPGGWYHVEGTTITGWIIADPTYTASGVLSSISFQDKQIDGILFPIDWTYADDQGEIVFQPQTGTQLPTLVIRTAANLGALGATGLTGYNAVSSNAEVVACGYTGTLVQYAASPSATPEPTMDAGGAQVTRLADFAQFRATLSSSFALDIEINYSTSAEYTVFENVLNSIRYPFPDCEAGTGSPSPSPG
ncbi:MAG: SH3 domain-containing protein [Candidatus Dormiibacterota bacterium]|jgi:hypothetical protein